MSTIQNTASTAATASFVICQIGRSVLGTFEMGYPNPAFGQVAWVTPIESPDKKLANYSLLTPADAGVSSIKVAYANSSHTDAQGNAHRQVGSYTTTSGDTRTATDIWVQTNATQSLPTDWEQVPADIAALPDAQGYGLVRDLHQAMAMDASGHAQTTNSSISTSSIQISTSCKSLKRFSYNKKTCSYATPSSKNVRIKRKNNRRKVDFS